MRPHHPLVIVLLAMRWLHGKGKDGDIPLAKLDRICIRRNTSHPRGSDESWRPESGPPMASTQTVRQVQNGPSRLTPDGSANSTEEQSSCVSALSFVMLGVIAAHCPSAVQLMVLDSTMLWY